jgi:hypothetical protein
MSNTLPYLASPGYITKLLTKIKTAATPERFSQEFLNSTLNMKGGTANSLISFLKKMGFLDSAGVPTTRYNEYRNDKKSGVAIGDAIRQLYAPLYQKNESAHTLGKAELQGLIVEYTGKGADDRVTETTLYTFETLKKLADFSASKKSPEATANKSDAVEAIHVPEKHKGTGASIKLGYSINLYLPATKDIEVFNAIFKSLKVHLLEEQA